MVAVDPSLMMWLTFAVIVIAVVSYATEYFTLEFTSLGVIAVLLVLFEFFPVATASGPISSSRLLAGFADPARDWSTPARCNALRATSCSWRGAAAASPLR
jgi:hypothetical protein